MGAEKALSDFWGRILWGRIKDKTTREVLKKEEALKFGDGKDGFLSRNCMFTFSPYLM